MSFFRDKDDGAPGAAPHVEPTLPMPERKPPARPAGPFGHPALAPLTFFLAPPSRQQPAGAPPPPASGNGSGQGKPPEGGPPAHQGSGLNRLPLKMRIALAIPAGLLGILALVVGGLLVHYTIVFPDPLSLRHKERAPVIRILARDGSVLAERGTAHEYMPIDLLPKHVTDAVVATEDRRFWEHWGLDPWGLIRAVFANMRAGRFAQGGSTLTQQLAKNLFLSSERTLGRKIEELVLAIWLEVRLSKRDILELYLNQVYFGGGAYGIEAAAHRYFDKSASELNVTEAALIAGLLKAPSKYSPAASPGAARARGRTVLKKMLEAGLLSQEDERKALRQRIQFATSKGAKEPTGAEYAVEFVLERMPALIAADHSEIVVETTIDAALQRRAQEVVETRLKLQGEAQGAGQAAVAILDTDGGIRALIGGRSHAESQFNRAVKARRQPGSAFKPLVYLAALEAGYTPDTVAYDLPLSVAGWSPRNDNGRYIGAVSLRQALSQSINTVAVRLLLDVGARKVAAVARRLGIASELREQPALALGSSELSLLELTGAYTTFSNGGLKVEPHAIRRVRLSSGRVLFARDTGRPIQAITTANVGAMNDMLNATLVSGTGKRAALAEHPAAGKTGTTSDFRDAWFVGYTAHLTGGVWVGNDSAKTMNKVMGGSLPALIWHDIMAVAHKGKAPLALPGTNGAGRDFAHPPTQQGVEPEQIATPLAPEKPRADTAPVAEPISSSPMPGQPETASAGRPVAAPQPQPRLATPSAPPAPAAPTAEHRPSVREPSATAARPARQPSSAAAAKAVRQPATAPPSHPKERIDEDFIARALEPAHDPASGEPTVADKGGAGFDVDDVQRRLRGNDIVVVKPPPGMMTLGKPQDK